MALALYLVTAAQPVTISTLDLSGSRPPTVLVPSGDMFLGDTTDPLVVKLLANGQIILSQADIPSVANGTLFNWNETNQKTSFQVGTFGAELAYQLCQAYINYWEWC